MVKMVNEEKIQSRTAVTALLVWQRAISTWYVPCFVSLGSRSDQSHQTSYTMHRALATSRLLAMS